MARNAYTLKTQGRVLSADKYLSEEQLRSLLRYVERRACLARLKGNTRAVIDELIILIFVYTGLQSKELFDLNIRDISTKKEFFIIVRNNKGKILRKMTIPSDLAEKLERFIKLYRKKAKGTVPLFLSEKGNRLGYNSIYNKLRGIGKRLSMKLHPNILRHTFLINLFIREKDLKYVQEQAGYSSIRAALVYFNTVIGRTLKIR